MEEKKSSETMPVETNEQSNEQTGTTPKPQEKAPETVVVIPTSPETRIQQSGLRAILSIHKTPPNDLYRRLLPAVLFLMTFVTVMTMLLIYMDTVAMGAQQFRLNMTRDYEIRRIRQDEPSLVAYVRQLHLTPRVQPAGIDLVPQKTRTVEILDEIYGADHVGTFVEILSSGDRDAGTLYLEAARGWEGVVARASPRDYLSLRGRARALHACLSPVPHPREVPYRVDNDGFRSRVLCLPLYTTLLAAELTDTDYLLVGGEHASAALTTLPYESVHLQVIEARLPNDTSRDATTEFLTSKNYIVKAEFDDGVLYTLDYAVKA